MDYPYPQEGWGPLQHPFNPNSFPTYSSVRDTHTPFDGELILDPSLIIDDALSALPLPYSSSSLTASIDNDINPFQPRYYPYPNEIPQTPNTNHHSFPGVPPSISPRDIHTPRFTGLEVSFPSFEPNPDIQQSSPLFNHAKIDHPESRMDSDTETESESDSEIDSVPSAPVNRNLLKALSRGSLVPARSPSSAHSGNEELGSPSKVSAPSPVPSVPALIEQGDQTAAPSTTKEPTLVSSASVKSTRVKAGRSKAVKPVVSTPEDKKASSGRQVLLAKKVKPGRGPRAIKAATTKKASTDRKARKRTSSTTSLSSSSGRTTAAKKLKTASLSVKPSHRKLPQMAKPIKSKTRLHTDSVTASDATEAKSGKGTAVKSASKSSSKTTSTSSLNSRSQSESTSKSVSKARSNKIVASTMSKSKNSKSKIKLKTVGSLPEEEVIPSAPPSPALTDDFSDVADNDYQPSPSPALDVLEDESDDDRTSPPLTKKKRSRQDVDDDEDWGTGKKGNRKKAKPAKPVNHDLPLKDRKVNKARNQFYHPGRQEQNVRAQSKYRNKIKARGDLVLHYFKKVLEEKRSSKLAKSFKDSVGLLEKEFLVHMKDLDLSFAQAEFGNL